jgi:hypothetical protein
MSVHTLLAPPPVAVSSIGEYRKRQFRWRTFQILFTVTCFGIALDVATTAMWFQRMGSRYEQNPIGGALIGHFGWPGLCLLLAVLCCTCFLSFRTVYWRMSTAWSAVLNVVLLLVATSRWIVVAAAVIPMFQPN